MIIFLAIAISLLPLNPMALNFLKNKIKGNINIIMTDSFGQEITSFLGHNNPGINPALWNMRPHLKSRFLRPASILDYLVKPREYAIIPEPGNKRFSNKKLK